jgi:uncharacterized membrane protein YkoI
MLAAMTIQTFIVTVLLAGLLALSHSPLAASEDDAADTPLQQDEARQALKSGLVLPLEEILTRIRKAFPGDVIEIEFEKDDGRFIYEIEMIRPDGRLIELKVDAGTAAVIEMGDD